MIAKETLESIFNTPFFPAKDNWKARCPYHTERTPSFYVHKYDGIANCFGCGISGSLDLLVASFLGISEREARERLDWSLTDQLERARRNVRASEPRTHQVFPESWLSPWKKEVHRSVLQRGFGLDTLKLAETRYDSSAQRQVFPHRRRDGKLVGALGRTCNGDKDKWYFYWEYDKGRHLYRPFELQSTEPLIIVEGVFDALWLYQHGYRNVCAILGSKATVAQILEIKDSATSVLCCLDNDEAGREGTRRLFKALRKSLPIRITSLPTFAKDPCDLSGEQLDECIRMAKTPGQLSLSGEARWLFKEDKRRSYRKESKLRQRSVGAT